MLKNLYCEGILKKLFNKGILNEVFNDDIEQALLQSR